MRLQVVHQEGEAVRWLWWNEGPWLCHWENCGLTMRFSSSYKPNEVRVLETCYRGYVVLPR